MVGFFTRDREIFSVLVYLFITQASLYQARGRMAAVIKRLMLRRVARSWEAWTQLWMSECAVLHAQTHEAGNFSRHCTPPI